MSATKRKLKHKAPSKAASPRADARYVWSVDLIHRIDDENYEVRHAVHPNSASAIAHLQDSIEDPAILFFGLSKSDLTHIAVKDVTTAVREIEAYLQACNSRGVYVPFQHVVRRQDGSDAVSDLERARQRLAALTMPDWPHAPSTAK